MSTVRETYLDLYQNEPMQSVLNYSILIVMPNSINLLIVIYLGAVF